MSEPFSFSRKFKAALVVFTFLFITIPYFFFDKSEKFIGDKKPLDWVSEKGWWSLTGLRLLAIWLLLALFAAALTYVLIYLVERLIQRRRRELNVSPDAPVKKHDLWFEIFPRESQVYIDGYGGQTRSIVANVKLRCIKDSERVLATKDFHASLYRRSEPDDILLVPMEWGQIAWDEKRRFDKHFDKGIVIDKPYGPEYLVQFHLEISIEDEQSLASDLFIRISMFVAGREDPFSLDLYVPDWQTARDHHAGNISLGRPSPAKLALAEHHESG